MQIRLFRKTRWQLATWYAVVMALILSLCGFVVYEVIIDAYVVSINRELESVAGTLHDVIEPNLKQPGITELVFQQVLPNICLAESSCPTQKILSHSQSTHNEHGIFSPVYKDKQYYIRFVDGSGRLIAVAGFQANELPPTVETQVWQTVKDLQGNRYSQKSLLLHTQDNQDWGYIQVGRNLNDLDNRLAALKLILAVGLPITVLLVGGSSWWLAGLAMRPIDSSYKQMQQFTSDASHELRTPLAAINATVETLFDMDYLPEEARDVLASIQRQNHRLAELVQDMLLLSRLEQQTLATQQVHCCLNILINDLIEEFSALAAAASLQLTSLVLCQELLYVMGDEDQLLRVLSNLIANAIQYTPAGGYVTVILKRSNGNAVIEVQDTGIGIASHEQKRIFDRFYRVNSDRSRRTGGSGLGLAIAQAIVQAHGGSIQVQSQIGKGSTFIVHLPLTDEASDRVVLRDLDLG
ncbi:two-component sensor histidine kinase [Fischerella thermalis CCMEE 5330]|uniref:histidine kinase n=2 Tax=Nostocales TaxID=1161 RepID=A0A2H6LKK4_9NOSO|nr:MULTISPECIES: two-component system sensor histidine kinase RppB [Nostocales]PMB48957.1 two-component sensor histidine kinase [Fischerella thermalis CCMEE 5330]GBE93749.1 two-component sensor histidine kinase [Nostoc cycadae WK-1]